MGNINSKAKGKRGELELVEQLRHCGYANARRSVQYCGKTGDAPDLVGVDGLHIECKRTEHFMDEKALQQAERDSKKGDLPIVCHRRSREKWKVTLRMDMFMAIWGELNELQRHNITEKIKFSVKSEKIGKQP